MTETTETNEHPGKDIETIRIDPNQVLEMMLRNHRDKNERRSHVLRVTPPLKGTKKAEHHVAQPHTRYPNKPRPIHLSAQHILEGSPNPNDLKDIYRYPNRSEIKRMFRDEYDIKEEDGAYRKLTHEQKKEFNEWMENAIETWEDEVRQACNDKTAKLIQSTPNYPATKVEIQFIEDK